MTKSAAMPIFDTLAYNQTLVESGVPDKQAQAMTRAMEVALGQGVARHEDIVDLTSAMKADNIAGRNDLKTEITAVRNELKADIASVRSELKAEMASVRSDMGIGFSKVEIGFTKVNGKFHIIYIMVGLVLLLQASRLPWVTHLLPFLK